MKSKSALAGVGIFLAMCCIAAQTFTIKLYTDFPNSTPISSDFLLFQRGNNFINSAQSQYLPVWFNNPVFTGNGSINGTFNVGSTLTVGGAVITGVTYYGDGSGLSNVASQVYLKNLNDFGTNESFYGNTFFQELDVATAYLTNTFVFITNAPFLETDGNGQVVIGVELPGTNVLLSAGDNIVFATNGSGGITIGSSGTNVITTVTNNTFVNTNVLIVTSNAFINNSFITNLYTTINTNNTFVNTNVLISTSNAFFNNTYITNLYSDTITNNTFVNTNLFISTTNFSTNLFFISGKGNTLVITNVFVAVPGSLVNSNTANNSAVVTDGAHAYTNAVNAHGVFTNSATGPPLFGLLQNTELVNSSLTIAGTANQVSVSGGGPVSLGGTATLSLPSPTIFPGKIAVTGLTNTGETSLQGVETNTTMGTGLIHSDNLGKRSSSLLVAADVTAGISPILNLTSSTNLIYRYTTNALTAITMTFGNAYTTNVSANIVFTAINAQDLAALETVCLFATNSGGTDRTITLPNGIGSPGLGLPPVITVTNKQSCWIYVQHYGNQATNCWFIPSY